MRNTKARVKRPRSKKTCQMIHLKTRWKERIGTELTKGIHDKLVTLIKKGESVLIEKKSHRVSVHKVLYETFTVKVVYDSARKQLVTVYPMEEK